MVLRPQACLSLLGHLSSPRMATLSVPQMVGSLWPWENKGSSPMPAHDLVADAPEVPVISISWDNGPGTEARQGGPGLGRSSLEGERMAGVWGKWGSFLSLALFLIDSY